MGDEETALKKIFQKVVYSIHDNGMGIAKNQQEKIWNVFFRINTQSNTPGDGIGLSIVKRIVDKHKGSIRLESEESKGSTFFIELNFRNLAE